MGFFSATWKYVLLPIIVAFLVFNLLQSPKYSGSIEIRTQKYNPIVIKRDQNGVPSIEAKTLKDTMYGLGYAQGQDRLWNIHSRKLLVSGRLSEIAGEKAIVVDKFFRNIALKRYCEYALENIDQPTQDLFQAYVDGVNDYAASAKVLPLEFWVTWQSYEPLTVVDSLTSAKFVAFFLTFDFQFEFIMDTLEDVLGKERAAEILPYHGEKYLWNDIVVMNDDELKQTGLYEKFHHDNIYSAVQGAELPEERRPPKVARAAAKEPVKPAASETVKTQPKAQPEAAQKAQEKPKEKVQKQEKKPTSAEAENINLKMPEAQTGSNSWVIHGSLTETGKPILANDPHLMNNVPTVWYQSSLFYEDGKFASGVGSVGFPGIHIGRNNHVSWGITTLLSDTSDLFTMQIKDNKYFYEGEWHPLREYQEKIYVKGRKEPVEITIYESHHGVILDYYYADIFLTRNFKPKEGQRYALAWSGYVKEDQAYRSFFDMMNAKNVHQLLDSWKEAAEPAFSLVFASEQDIGFVGLGKIPIRKYARHGLKPRDGSLQDNDWLGFIPWESQPKIINPKKGYIVSANNKMASDNIKYGVSANMFPTTRAARIDEMIRDQIKQGKKFTVEDMMRMQQDTLDVAARDVTPILVNLTRQAIRKGYATQIDHQILHAMLNKLSTWDYFNDKESIPATIFNVWERYIIRKLLQKIGLKPDDVVLMTVNAKFEHFFFRSIIEWKDGITRNHDFWCLNNENEGKADPCLYNLAKSLEETWTFLDNKFGGDMEDWEWSNLHTMDYPHSTFSPTPLRQVFHRFVPSQGNGRTVNVARMKLETDNYAGVWSANLKMVISMRPGDKNYFIVDSGVSENVLSQHYDDQLHLVSDGKYLEMTLDKRSNWKTALYLNPRSK